MLELSQKSKYTVKINDILLKRPKRLFGNVVSVYILYICVSTAFLVTIYVIQDSTLKASPKLVTPAILTNIHSKTVTFSLLIALGSESIYHFEIKLCQLICI